MSRRVLGHSVPLALLLAATLTTPAPATGQYTVSALKFTVQVGSRTCTIDADLYRPSGVERAPAVLTTNGFGGSKSDGSTDATARAFAQRGYVSLAWSGLGFGRSGCLISSTTRASTGRPPRR